LPKVVQSRANIIPPPPEAKHDLVLVADGDVEYCVAWLLSGFDLDVKGCAS